MVKIIVDGKEYQVSEKKNLLEAVLTEKLNLQYFCWHPALGSVGACRQCAVKKFRDENDKTGRLVMACMEPVAENSIISINDPEAKEFREGVIEWLMVNHPHDCPVCDEGGECHLQDMTVMSGHNYRRYRFNKRTYRNQYLGPLVNHEMNRCIQCYRCVRYYRDYADGNDLDAFGIHNNVYFGRAEEGVLENEFSGNLVEVCPTGVFTDKTLGRHYTRKWDLTNGPSICNHCSVGCNTITSERYGKLRRILSRYNSEVNGYFICDRGRFGYEFATSEKRISLPLVRKRKEDSPVHNENIVEEVSSRIATGKTAGIGSPRASLESNFALMNLVGKENFYAGVGKSEYAITSLIVDIMQNGVVKTPSLKEIEECEAVFILGEDVTNTAPMTALALRQASKRKPRLEAEKLRIPEWHENAIKDLTQNARGPFYIAHPFPTKLDDIAAEVFYAAPSDIARFGFALAHKFNQSSPAVNGMKEDERKRIDSVSESLKDIKSAVVVCGTSLLNEGIIHSAYNLSLALNASGIKAAISFVVPECNSIGLNLMTDKNLDELIGSTGYDNFIVLENNLYRREEKKVVDKFLEKARNVIVIDHLMTETAEKADVVIPAGMYAETDGTLISNEGRAQRFYQAYDPSTYDQKSVVKESWRWIQEIGVHISTDGFSRMNILSDFTEALAAAFPLFKSLVDITPPPGYREAGQKIPREPHRFSGRTAMFADKSVHEPKPPEDVDSPLSFTMEGYRNEPPSSIIPFFWSPGWNSAQAIHKYQIETGGPLHGGDPGKRLFEPANAEGKYFEIIPGGYNPKQGEYLALPLYHIFGSEEQSNHAESMAKLIPQPYVMVSKADAERLQIGERKLKLRFSNSEYILKVLVSSKIREGILGIPFGLPGMEYVKVPSVIGTEVSG